MHRNKTVYVHVIIIKGSMTYPVTKLDNSSSASKIIFMTILINPAKNYKALRPEKINSNPVNVAS